MDLNADDAAFVRAPAGLVGRRWCRLRLSLQTVVRREVGLAP